MVGGIFPDTQSMINARNQMVQQAQAQNVANYNITQAKKEALRHVEQGRFTTVPTSVGTTIVRPNQIGYNAPSVTSMRGLTPAGSVQQAMKPSMQVTSPFTQGTSSGNLNQGVNVQSSDRSRAFLSGTSSQNKRII